MLILGLPKIRPLILGRMNVLANFSEPLYASKGICYALLFPRITYEHHSWLTNIKGRFCLDHLLLAVPSPCSPWPAMLFAPVSPTIMMQCLIASVFLMSGPGLWSLLPDFLPMLSACAALAPLLRGAKHNHPSLYH